MYQWIPFRLQRKSPKFPVVTENDFRYMLQCIKRTNNWTNSRAQISSDGHDRMGRKIQLPPPPPRKKSLGFATKSEKIPGPKNDITRCTCTPGIRRHYHETSDCFGYQKNPYLSQASPPLPRQRKVRNLPTPKNPKIKNFKPIQIPRSSPSPEVRSTPSLWDRNTPTWIQYCLLHNVLYFHIFFVLSI